MGVGKGVGMGVTAVGTMKLHSLDVSVVHLCPEYLRWQIGQLSNEIGLDDETCEGKAQGDTTHLVVVSGFSA